MAKTIHLDLSANSWEGEWVDIVDPWELGVRELNEWRERAESGALDNEQLLGRFVAAWHTKHFQTGEFLPDPSAETINDLRAGIAFILLNEITERLQELPKARLARA